MDPRDSCSALPAARHPDSFKVTAAQLGQGKGLSTAVSYHKDSTTRCIGQAGTLGPVKRRDL